MKSCLALYFTVLLFMKGLAPAAQLSASDGRKIDLSAWANSEELIVPTEIGAKRIHREKANIQIESQNPGSIELLHNQSGQVLWAGIGPAKHFAIGNRIYCALIERNYLSLNASMQLSTTNVEAALKEVVTKVQDEPALLNPFKNGSQILDLSLIFGRDRLAMGTPAEKVATLENITVNASDITIQLSLDSNNLEIVLSWDFSTELASFNGERVMVIRDPRKLHHQTFWGTPKDIKIPSSGGEITARTCIKDMDLKTQDGKIVPETIRVVASTTGQIWIGPSTRIFLQTDRGILGVKMSRDRQSIVLYEGSENRIPTEYGSAAAFEQILSSIDQAKAEDLLVEPSKIDLRSILPNEPKAYNAAKEFSLFEAVLNKNEIMVKIFTAEPLGAFWIHLTPDLKVEKVTEIPR